MADLVQIPLGKDAKLYYGTPAAAATTEITGVTDLTVVLEKEVAEITRRVTGGWKDTREGIKVLRLTFTIAGTVVDGVGTEVTTFNILLTAFWSGTGPGGNTGIALHAAAAPAANEGWGPSADFLITRFERGEGLGDAQMYNVEAEMTMIHGTTPTWTISPA